MRPSGGFKIILCAIVVFGATCHFIWEGTKKTIRFQEQSLSQTAVRYTPFLRTHRGIVSTRADESWVLDALKTELQKKGIAAKHVQAGAETILVIF